MQKIVFGVMDDQRMNTNLAGSNIPYVVTQINAFGYPSWQTIGNTAAFSGAYQMPDRGFTYTNGLKISGGGGMKAAFADFLKLRSGGSGFLFGYEQATVVLGVPHPQL